MSKKKRSQPHHVAGGSSLAQCRPARGGRCSWHVVETRVGRPVMSAAAPPAPATPSGCSKLTGRWHPRHMLGSSKLGSMPSALARRRAPPRRATSARGSTNAHDAIRKFEVRMDAVGVGSQGLPSSKPATSRVGSSLRLRQRNLLSSHEPPVAQHGSKTQRPRASKCSRAGRRAPYAPPTRRAATVRHRHPRHGTFSKFNRRDSKSATTHPQGKHHPPNKQERT